MENLLLGKKVLIIEDNTMNLTLVRTLLSMTGCHLFEAEDAESGILAAKKYNPDLILMDLQLPGMDGLQAATLLRSNPAFAGIVIVAVTSHAMPGDGDKALASGCDGYITKPIDTRTFVATLGDFLYNTPVT